MFRRGKTLAAVALATLFALAPARAGEDMRTAAQYLQGLRDQGDFDLADEYLEKPGQARASFDQARPAYGQAGLTRRPAFKAFPPFIPDNDPRKAERDRTQIAMMDAALQKAVVDYEQGQTYAAGSPARGEYLAKG